MEQFRQRLMALLLAKNGWCTNDINYNLNAPTPLAFQLDDDGWYRHGADPLEWLKQSEKKVTNKKS
jgi:hypothetical protein